MGELSAKLTEGVEKMIEYKHNLIKKAQKLRCNATPQENKLWYEFLRTYPIRFQRQKAIDRFIVDFYCFKAKLIIEIDGSQHYERANKEYDDVRTAKLEQYGIKVLRFSNYEIDTYFNEVCESIDNEIKQRI